MLASNEMMGQESVNECKMQKWFGKFRRSIFDHENTGDHVGLPATYNNELKSLVEAGTNTTI